MKDAFCTLFGLTSGFIAKIVTHDPAFSLLTAFAGGFLAYFGTTFAKWVHTYFKNLAHSKSQHNK